MRTCPFKNPKALAIAKNHNASVAQVCLRWIMQKGCIMAVGTGSNPAEVTAYAVRSYTSLCTLARRIALNCSNNCRFCRLFLVRVRLCASMCVSQKENLGIFNITLTDEDMAVLDKM